MNPVLVPLAFIFMSLIAVSTSSFGAGSEPDLLSHPVYAKYQFGNSDDKVVDLGTHPMTAPVGVLGATFGRDRLLRTALKEHSWEFRSHSFLKGPDANFFFLRGDLEVAIAGDWPTLTLAATTDLLVVGLAKQGFTSIITTKDKRRIENLKGMRIGSAPGTTAHYGLLVGLTNAGLKEADVTIVPMDAGEMIEALKKGTIDAFTAWEPTPTDALRMHPEFSVVQRFMNNSYIYFSAGFVKKNPEISELMVAAYIRSLRWMRDDRKNLLRAVSWALQDTAQMTGRPSTISSEDMAKTTTDDLLKIAASPIVPAQDLAEKGSVRRAFAFLQAQEKIGAAVPWKKIEQSFDSSLIEKILASPEKYQLFSFDYDD